MTYGYIRVSSDKQTVENQRFEINRFCASQKLKIDGWIEETISGTKNYCSGASRKTTSSSARNSRAWAAAFS